MKPMQTWETLEVDVLSVDLDPLNVRLDYPANAAQDEIIYDLFKSEKVLDLVESIAKVGLLEHELPVVLQRKDDLVVVEGNRRVAALKAIQNPMLVPQFQARIEKLVSTIPNREALRQISARKAPSQDEADRLIAALHTGSQRRPWSPTRRAEFFQAKVDSGETLQQLMADYPTINVREYVHDAQLVRLFRSADFSDPTLKDYLNDKRFPITVFARLYDNDEFLELARITTDPVTEISTAAPPFIRFSELVEKIVADTKSKRISTRVLNSQKSTNYRAYMRELEGFLSSFPDDLDDTLEAADTSGDTSEPGDPPTPVSDFNLAQEAQTAEPSADEAAADEAAAKGTPTTPARDNSPIDASILESSPDVPDIAHPGKAEPSAVADQSLSQGTDVASDGGASTIASGSSANVPNSSRSKNVSKGTGTSSSRPAPRRDIYLKTESLVVPATWPVAMHQTYSELSRLNYRTFPIAMMDLLRTVLEKSIKAYAHSNGTSVRAELSRQGVAVGKFEQLGDCLTYFEQHLKEKKDNRLLQVVRRLQSSAVKSWGVSSTYLNAINHNPDICASAEDVEAVWAEVSSVLRFMLAS